MAFAPGENGSQGQNLRKPVRTALMALMSRSSDDQLKDTPQNIAQKLAMHLLRDALKGNEKARTEVIDRVDGKPAQAVIGGEDDDPPVRILVEADKDIITRYLDKLKGKP
jgi:hypothetical protein